MSAAIDDRIPPQDLDAECSVLGCMLLANESIDNVTGSIEPEHFYGDAHRRIAKAIFAMHASNSSGIDVITLSDELRRQNELEEVGGTPYLLELLEIVPHAAYAQHYANIVREKWTRRSLIYASTEIIRECYDGANSADELLQSVERKVFDIAENRLHGNTERDTSLTAAMTEAFDSITQRADGVNTGLPTGLTDIDSILNGFKPGQLIILAARPSCGKTALGLNISHNITNYKSTPVLFISLEQSRSELAERLLKLESGVDGENITTGKLSQYELSALGKSSNKLTNQPLFIDDSDGVNATQIASIARRHRRKHGIKLLIVDYLQLIEEEGRRDTREQHVAATGRKMKRLARELGIPILCLAQLNRQAADKVNERPRMSNLRESGALEQDADVVMLIHRPSAVDPDNRPGEAELIIEKHRNGKVGIVNLVWDGPRMKFLDAAPYHTVLNDGGF